MEIPVEIVFPNRTKAAMFFGSEGGRQPQPGDFVQVNDQAALKYSHCVVPASGAGRLARGHADWLVPLQCTLDIVGALAGVTTATIEVRSLLLQMRDKLKPCDVRKITAHLPGDVVVEIPLTGSEVEISVSVAGSPQAIAPDSTCSDS